MKSRPKQKPRKRKAAKASARKPTIGGKYNLLVTFNPNHAAAAQKELAAALARIGEKPKISAAQSEGIFKVNVSDARKVISRLEKLCHADPNLFAATYHYTPIDAWCGSSLSEMQRSVRKLAAAIHDNEKWKLAINKRMWDRMNAAELVTKLADVVEKEKVDLEKPAKIIQVEIIGREAGISLLQPGEFLNIPKLKGVA